MTKRIDARDKTLVVSSFRTPPRTKPSQAEVIAVGPACRDHSGKLIPIEGRRRGTCLASGRGTEIKIDGEVLRIMKEGDMMGVLTDLAIAKQQAA